MNTADNFIRQFQQNILETIIKNRLFDKGDAVVVGVSGGPDSVCLLHVFHSLIPDLDIKLHAIHINHMLRADEALADEKYTGELCNKMDVPLIVVRANVAGLAKEKGMSLEEAGREVRYSEFDKLAKNIGAKRVAVAHNRNDQAETVMMHIIRGTGTAGLTGMEPVKGAVIRPLLGVSRSDIEKYCEKAGLCPRTDSTNLKSDFTRNRVRLELFPYINEKFGTDISESLCRLSSHAAEDNNYLEQCALDAYEKSLADKAPGQVSLKLDQLSRLHPAILWRVLKLAITYAAGSSKGIGSIHYRTLSELINKRKTGALAELPGNIRASISYGIFKIYTGRTETPNFDKLLVVPGTTELEEMNALIKTSVNKANIVDKYPGMGYNSFVQFFDYDSLSKGINIRNRRDGDIFKPFGSTGTKKLKKYFIDSKIPRETRDLIPLLCVDNEVVWIVGYKISDKFKVTENTKSVIKIEYNRRT